MEPALTKHSVVGVAHPSATLPVTHATPLTNSLRKNDGEDVEAIVIGSTLLSTLFHVTLTGIASPGAVPHGI